ncbi:cobaltochelatase subunit CobN [Desulfobacula toluolica]|uniref:Predicted hydrogenobyrinic acid a,c-diamide cobaltochelatase n=1 Tax=Desulfobacula toluolica (strain DSM 7467 / Tol2) TaxID=651182 RepID=K0NK95_DESTT|nr:cobaltochelatase subunit CobN [Desulfobacula toluolica]CCK81270.1 predicted hydrogenobyrinic acid a,c-diamide cobaltochelatase [Desulfobacula toluolica Tol2]
MKRLIVLLFFWPWHLYAADMAFMVLDHNSYLACMAVEKLDLPIDIKVITSHDVTRDAQRIKQEIQGTNIIVADVMGREFETFLTDHIDLDSKIIYALRGSLDNESLVKKGFVFDSKVAEYYSNLSKENIQNMLRLIAHRHIDNTISYDKVLKIPRLGVYHPDAPDVFIRVKDFLTWQKNRPGFDSKCPRIGLVFFSSFLTKGQKAPIDTLIQQLENNGFNVMPCFGREQNILKSFLLDESGSARVDLVLAYSFKFYNALTPELGLLLNQLDVPVISAVSLYKNTIDHWRKSPVGIDSIEVAWSLAVPELSGLVEPNVLSAKQKVVDPKTKKSFFLSRPVMENIDRLIPRLKKWIALQQKPNPEKKLAIMFYNHHQGKQNIGASYLNVFQSLETILQALKENGYTTGKPLSEQEIKELILSSARNIGSWAPGELDKLISTGKVVRLPVETYNHWFEDLPQDFKNKVIQQWGGPEESGIMIHGKDFIIPAVQAENMILLPEPVRGWGDDPMKLYHDTTLYPHHQYLAVYLWLSKHFKADAIIHLGTHSTYEWTPGKQAGLSPSCPPEVLISDIPNIYPYIVDDVGEGIQAKRRGRGVIISHLTPILKTADLHEDYSRMAELANEYERATARQSVTAEEKFKELMALAKKTGILKDIQTTADNHKHGQDHTQDDGQYSSQTAGEDVSQDEMVHLLGHYLEEIKENLIPFGMHTFGRSPDPDETTEMADAILKWNPEQTKKDLASRLARSGRDEVNAMISGLDGRYIRPGPGNDPVRNPDAMPTGRNFYGFNPGKLPSPAAWSLGKKAARKIIENHIMKNGSYPQNVAVVLWAVETLRNEGVNESTIMYLIGTKPRWSKTGRVLGIDVIPANRLNRPRIDVMINASGLYRDLFPEKMLYLDKAIRLAAKQTDIENLIARHNRDIKTRLIKQGMDPEKADQISRFRVFSEAPGSYGNGVSEMASGSSKWENPDQVVNVFENRMGFAFGAGQWGIRAKGLLKEQLSTVDVTLHSRSSNVYGLLDNDDMFQYLGGLSMAARHESGKTPETLITQQQKKGKVNVEDMAKTLGREMRSRYLNPKWIDGMKKEDYAGAKAMADFVEYLWGWNMTTPEKVDASKWRQVYEVYVEDKYGLELDQFFNKASPWAFQSITARMLETSRKGYWEPDQAILETLAAEYATSVIQKGIACCDHTCNNPVLNQMVISIISIPGVLNPKLVEQFKLAVEQMAGKSMEQQVADQKALLEELAAPAPSAQEATSEKKDSSLNNDIAEVVEGYKMEKIKNRDDTTQMTSSGIEWMAVLAVLAVMGLAAYGARKKER